MTELLWVPKVIVYPQSCFPDMWPLRTSYACDIFHHIDYFDNQ